MNSIYFLSDRDFKVSSGTNGNILTTGISGFSMVLFYSTKCVHCKNLIPIFQQLPNRISGCRFVMINITQYPSIIRMSQETKVPIQFVPLIIFYINGKPYLPYKGPFTLNQLEGFIIEITSQIPKHIVAFNRKPYDSYVPEKRKYTLGLPYLGDNVENYAIMKEAYTKSMLRKTR